MRKIILFISILFVCVNLSAQNVYPKRYRSNEKHESTIGFKFGPSFSKMIYDIDEFSEVGQKSLIGPCLGVYIDYHFNKDFSIAPELMYLTKGVYHDSYIFRNRYNASYKLTTHYAALRVPLVYKVNLTRYIQPYFYVAPEVVYCVGGKLEYVLDPIVDNYDPTGDGDDVSSDGGVVPLSKGDYLDLKKYNIHKDITTADIKRWDVSAIVGTGVRLILDIKVTYLLAKIDFGYNIGLTSNYGTAINNITKVMGNRYHRSFECMMSIGIPINYFRDKQCVDFESPFDMWY